MILFMIEHWEFSIFSIYKYIHSGQHLNILVVTTKHWSKGITHLVCLLCLLLRVCFPECWSSGEHISDDDESHGGKRHADQGTEYHIQRMMSIVWDSGQADPQTEYYHTELKEGSHDLEDSQDKSDALVVGPGHVVEPGLEVDDEEHPAVETEAGVSGQEWQPSINQLLLGELSIDEVVTHLVILNNDKLLISKLIMAQLWCQFDSTSCQIEWPESAHRVLGQLSEEKRGQCAQAEESKVTVELHQDPGCPVVEDGFVSASVLHCVGPETLHENNQGDGDHGPDDDTGHDRDSLRQERMLQVLVIAEESPRI